MAQPSDDEIVRKAVDELIEHFDTATVMVTRHDQASLNGTMTCVMGAGNWFARYGQIRAWVLRQEEKAKNEGPM
jgi:ABC-type uncharacterized transport system ATPase component